MKIVSKALIGSVAAGALALASATPAMARDRDRHDGISAGEVLAGALVIGGVAAVAAAASNNHRNDYRYDDARYGDYRNSDYRYGDRRDNRRDYQREAVNLCVRAAESGASRFRYGGNARVTQIRDINRERGGFEVKGRIAVQDRGRNYRRASYDQGSFKCQVRAGRVVDLDYSGIRGL